MPRRKSITTKPESIIMPGDEDILDVEGAAAYLHYAPKTIRNLASLGTLPRCKPQPGRRSRLLFVRGDLRRWVMSGRQAAAYELEAAAGL